MASGVTHETRRLFEYTFRKQSVPKSQLRITGDLRRARTTYGIIYTTINAGYFAILSPIETLLQLPGIVWNYSCSRGQPSTSSNLHDMNRAYQNYDDHSCYTMRIKRLEPFVIGRQKTCLVTTPFSVRLSKRIFSMV